MVPISSPSLPRLLTLPDAILAQVASCTILTSACPDGHSYSWSWPPNQLLAFALTCRRTYLVTAPLRHRVISAPYHVQRTRIPPACGSDSCPLPLLPPLLDQLHVPLYYWGPYLVTSLGHVYEHGRKVDLGKHTRALDVCLANGEDIEHVPVPALESFSHHCSGDGHDDNVSGEPRSSAKNKPPPLSPVPVPAPKFVVSPLGLSPLEIDTLLAGILSQTSLGHLRHLRFIGVPLHNRRILSTLATWPGRAQLESLELDPRVPVSRLDLSSVHLPKLRRFLLRCRMVCRTRVEGLPYMPLCDELLVQAHDIAYKACGQVRLLHRLTRLTLTLYTKSARFQTLPSMLSSLPPALAHLTLYSANGDNLLDLTRPLPSLLSLTLSYYADPNPWIQGPHESTLWSPGIPLLCGTKFPQLAKLRVAMGVVTPGLVCTLASLPSLKVVEFGKGVRALALSESVVMSGTGDGRWPSLAWIERVEGPGEVVDFLIAHVDMPRLKSITYKAPLPFAPTTAFVALFNASSHATCSPTHFPTSSSSTSNPSSYTPTNAASALLQAAASLTATTLSPTSPTSPTSSAFASYQQHSAAATLANAAGYGYYKLTPAQQRASAASLAALCKAHGVDVSAGGGLSPIESILTTPNGGVSFAYASRNSLAHNALLSGGVPSSGGGGAAALVGKGKAATKKQLALQQQAHLHALGCGAGEGYEALVTSMLVSLIPGATEDVAPGGGAAALNKKAREIAAVAASAEFARGHVCTEVCKQFMGTGGWVDRDVGVSQMSGAGKTVASLPPTPSGGGGGSTRRKSGECLGFCCADANGGMGSGSAMDLKAMVNALIQSPSSDAPLAAAAAASSSSPGVLATAQIVNAFTAEFLREYSLPTDPMHVPGAAAAKSKTTARVFKRLDVLDVSDVPHARVSMGNVADMPLGAHLVAHARHVSALFTSPAMAPAAKLTRLTLVAGSPLALTLRIDPRAHLPFLEHLTLGRSPVALGKYDRDACRGPGCRVRAAHDWDFWDLREWELAYAAVEEGSGPFAGLITRKKHQPAAGIAKNAFAEHAAPLDPRVRRVRLEPGVRAIEWITGLPALKKLSVLQPIEVLVDNAVAVKLTVANRESSGVWAALAKYVIFVQSRGSRGVAAIHVAPGAKLQAGFAAKGQGAFKSMWMREPGFQHLVDKLSYGVLEEAHERASRRGPKGARVVPATSHGASAMVVGPAGVNLMDYPHRQLWLARAEAEARSQFDTASPTMPLARADSGVDHGSAPVLNGQGVVRGKATAGEQTGAGSDTDRIENGFIQAAI